MLGRLGTHSGRRTAVPLFGRISIACSRLNPADGMTVRSSSLLPFMNIIMLWRNAEDAPRLLPKHIWDIHNLHLELQQPTPVALLLVGGRRNNG